MKLTAKKRMKLGFKIAAGAICIVPAASLFLAQIDTPTYVDSHYELNNKFFRNIVEENSSFGDAPLTSISMLASHDSLSDGINFYSKANPFKTNTFGDIYKLAAWFGKGALARFSKAQNNNIYEQLDAGVRYIDARITLVDGVYYNEHGLISDTLENNLKLILQWLNDNPGEFVMFHIYYFYHDESISETKAWNDLGNYIEGIKVNNKNLFEYDHTLDSGTHFSQLTYNKICPLDAQSQRQAGAVIFHKADADQVTEEESSLWCYKHIALNNQLTMYHPCAMRMNSDAVLDHTKEAIAKATELAKTTDWKLNTIRYIQTQTTPTFDDVGPTITAWSLLQKAYQHNDFMLRHSGIDWTTALDAMPIYMCDYATLNANGFQSELIKMLSDRNKTLHI